MKEILKLGLVMSVLLCVAIGAASAQEGLSEDYKDGFYEGATLWAGGVSDYNYLMGFYYDLGGDPTDETTVVDNQTVTWSDYYNQQATIYNDEEVPFINGRILEIFGPDDDRTEALLLPEVPLIS